MWHERSKSGEAITDWEYETLKENNKCPNCLVGQVICGLSSSISTNYRCPYCGQGYNLTIMSHIENIGIDEKFINIKYQRERKLKKLNESRR